MNQSVSGKHPRVVIVDFGSQYTQVIGRTLRELGFRSVIISPQRIESYLETVSTQAVILSGGSASVYDQDAPTMSKKVLECDIPILGICYGMQWIAQQLGGKIIAKREHKEYGEAQICVSNDELLFFSLKNPQKVWVSHGDSVQKIPPGFQISASSVGSGTVAGMSNKKQKIWGVQFHPEVTQTDFGKVILLNFLSKICKCQDDWYPANIAQEIREEVQSAVGKAKVIGGFSGGVDSTTVMTILASALKENLQAVCIDTGALRLDELKVIRKNARAASVRLRVIDAVGDFGVALSDVIDAEEKRKRFKLVYASILEKAAKDFGAKYLIQGSLATDIIESGRVGNAALIKSHHNVGLKINLKELHPFRNLFKYEVRDLSRRIGLPETVSGRHPFPGPGLFIRIIGQPATPERLDTIRWADAEVAKIVMRHGLYGDFSQLIVALACIPTVGIKGDGRSYESSVVVRGVKTQDFMTVEGYQFPPEVRREISNAVTKHPKIVRVWFDETNKPPATTELE